MNRYVIIGMGVSGVSAAMALRQIDSRASITMVSDDPYLYYSRPGLAYYLDDEIPEKQLQPFNSLDWKSIGVKLVKGKAIGLNPASHLVELKNAQPIRYDRLLLATGAASMKLKIAGEEFQGVVKLDDFEDTRQIISLSKHARSAVVVGGGVVSMEMVEGLLRRGVKVHYLLRGDRYWANVLDEAESHIIEKRLAHDGVLLHYHTEIQAILGKKGKVTGVQTKKGEVIPCGIVGVCIGVRARMELAQSGGLQTERGILADEHLQTSEADIYTAGDCAQILDPQTGKKFMDSLWIPGRIQGTIAAQNMSGQKQAYQRKVDVNVLRLAGIMLTIIGGVGAGRDEDLVSVARGSSETWKELPNSIAAETGNEINNLRLMVGERTIVGAVVLGDQKVSFPLQDLVSAQTDITPIRSQLLQAGAPLGQLLMDYWYKSKEGRGANAKL